MLERLKPTVATGSTFQDTDPELLLSHLAQQGPIKAGTLDIDNSLLAHHGTRVPDENIAIIKAFFELGVPLGINSNAASEERDLRARTITQDISERVGEELPVLTTYILGGQWYYRKPFRRSFDVIAETMGTANREMFHAGDQLGKDVLGANRAGYRSVYVEPCAPATDPKKIKYGQRAPEAVLLAAWNVELGRMESVGWPVEPSSRADGYRSVGVYSGGTALLAAIASTVEIIDGQVGAGIVNSVWIPAFLSITATMRSCEKQERIIEKLIAIGDREHNDNGITLVETETELEALEESA